MTPETMAAAMVSIEALFRAVWSPRVCDYPNVPFTIEGVAATDQWARFRLQHNTAGQATLAGNDGNSRWSRRGNVLIELFFPLGAGVKTAYNEAESIANAFEGERTANGVWFRDTRINEVNDGPSLWYPILVITDFVYEQYN